jgi:hypothetical protein
VLEALAEDLQQQVGDIVPPAGLGKQSLVTKVLIGAFLLLRIRAGSASRMMMRVTIFSAAGR